MRRLRLPSIPVSIPLPNISSIKLPPVTSLFKSPAEQNVSESSYRQVTPLVVAIEDAVIQDYPKFQGEDDYGNSYLAFLYQTVFGYFDLDNIREFMDPEYISFLSFQDFPYLINQMREQNMDPLEGFDIHLSHFLQKAGSFRVSDTYSVGFWYGLLLVCGASNQSDLNSNKYTLEEIYDSMLNPEYFFDTGLYKQVKEFFSLTGDPEFFGRIDLGCNNKFMLYIGLMLGNYVSDLIMKNQVDQLTRRKIELTVKIVILSIMMNMGQVASNTFMHNPPIFLRILRLNLPNVLEGQIISQTRLHLAEIFNDAFSNGLYHGLIYNGSIKLAEQSTVTRNLPSTKRNSSGSVTKKSYIRDKSGHVIYEEHNQKVHPYPQFTQYTDRDPTDVFWSLPPSLQGGYIGQSLFENNLHTLPEKDYQSYSQNVINRLPLTLDQYQEEFLSESVGSVTPVIIYGGSSGVSFPDPPQLSFGQTTSLVSPVSSIINPPKGRKKKVKMNVT